MLLPAKKGRIGCVQISAGLLPIRDAYGMRLDASGMRPGCVQDFENQFVFSFFPLFFLFSGLGV